LAAHCRWKEFSEYFLHLMECSNDEIYDEEWRTLLLAAFGCCMQFMYYT
jgi:hypothetical protein